MDGCTGPPDRASRIPSVCSPFDDFYPMLPIEAGYQDRSRYGRTCMKPLEKAVNKRKYVRVRVQFRSHFSIKGKMVGGDGELTDLSPGGCRVKSAVPVQPGADLELCIFPGEDSNPIMVDAAIVCWTHATEFGVSFASVRPPVLRRLTEVWRKLASPV
jgi:hypothetical protein